ncbi:MAG: NifB/NifX family molybdenum-iron cluster-binding protein [Candidatus Heimdallarchaeota archaeon]|nr:NifB/NifX family molybdenum-iron cluster-binding protein [Candidatus Heimdallarchaeota archaeon]
MKIAISTMGNTLNSDIDPRFGRCQNFIIVDTDDLSFEVITNEAQFDGHGAGLRSSQNIINKGIKAVISGSVGPNAFEVLKASNIYIYTATGQILEAIKKLKAGTLPMLTYPQKATGGRGQGAGMGRGRS